MRLSNAHNLPGAGDYNAFPNFGHPNDPRNDPDDDPLEPYREEIAALPEFQANNRDNFLEAVEVLDQTLVGMLIDELFAKHPELAIVAQAEEYWRAQQEIEAIRRHSRAKRVLS